MLLEVIHCFYTQFFVCVGKFIFVVCVCVRLCAHACVHEGVCVCVCVYARVHEHVCACEPPVDRR